MVHLGRIGQPHLTSGPEDETLQETAFETAIVAELEALGVHEYTIDPSWFEYIRSLGKGKRKES